MNDLVSVILPVYNVELYLEKCISSVVNQTYKNLQIILVDDGSTDSSGKICDKWASNDSRIEVIHKKNAGLGYARNSGLEISKGSFVMFVDSDDFIDLNMIEVLLNNINGADTVLCGHNVFYSDNHIEKKEFPFNGIIFENIKNDFIPKLIGALPEDIDDICFPVSVWHGLYSMKLIKKFNIKFCSERELISEDIIFDLDYFIHSKKISCIKECLYFYRKGNANSLTTIYNPERFSKEKKLYIELDSRLSKYISRDLYMLRLQRTFLGRVRSCIVRAVRQKSDTYLEIKKICDDTLVRDVLDKYPSFKCKFSLRLFNYFMMKKNIFMMWLLIIIRYKKR